jgi:hypothetical protein
MNLLRNIQFIIKYAVYCGFIIKYIVYCKLITGYMVYCKLIIKYTVYCNLLADVANLLQNARFIQFAKDHIQPPQLYGSPQTATNRNNQPQKKILMYKKMGIYILLVSYRLFIYSQTYR